MSLLSGFLSLAGRTNKVNQEDLEIKEGVVSDLEDELTLKKTDEELIELANQWEERWNTSAGKSELDRKQKENEKYWLGDHHTPAQKTTGKKELVDNLIFEALETFLPVITRQNPEPMVSSDDSDIGRLLSKKVADRLKDLADVLRMKLKLKKAARHWALYYLGCVKLGWSAERNEIALQVIRPQTLILDPDAITDECEYDGEYLGQYRTESAKDLAIRFPSKATYIKEKVNNKLGTKLRYVEWWTTDYLFWTLEGKILGKAKNPHWNYETTQTIPESVDEYGMSIPSSSQTIKGVNHFALRKIPFAFLSVFNLGKGPVDDSSLIEQTISQQDLINKRQRQIDRNADGMNAGAIVSGDAFTKEQAKQVADALKKGQTVWVPRGDINSVYKRDAGIPLPQFIYQSLIDSRAELRNVFGTSGISSSGIKSEETVRGKILVKGADTDRAALIVDHIEQFSDYIFNWMVQLMVVYYDEPRSVGRTQGATMIINSEFTTPLVVSVKEGSLIPKDRLTERNEAIDLWSAQAIDPLTFMERLEVPNPQESAKRLVIWKLNPMIYAQLYAPEAIQATIAGASPEASPESGNIPAESPIAGQSLLSEVPIQ